MKKQLFEEDLLYRNELVINIWMNFINKKW